MVRSLPRLPHFVELPSEDVFLMLLYVPVLQTFGCGRVRAKKLW